MKCETRSIAMRTRRTPHTTNTAPRTTAPPRLPFFVVVEEEPRESAFVHLAHEVSRGWRPRRGRVWAPCTPPTPRYTTRESRLFPAVPPRPRPDRTARRPRSPPPRNRRRARRPPPPPEPRHLRHSRLHLQRGDLIPRRFDHVRGRATEHAIDRLAGGAVRRRLHHVARFEKAIVVEARRGSLRSTDASGEERDPRTRSSPKARPRAGTIPTPRAETIPPPPPGSESTTTLHSMPGRGVPTPTGPSASGRARADWRAPAELRRAVPAPEAPRRDGTPSLRRRRGARCRARDGQTQRGRRARRSRRGTIFFGHGVVRLDQPRAVHRRDAHEHRHRR